MHNSIKYYHRKPTYDELIQEAIIHPTDITKYPNIIATQLINTPQLTRIDDEFFLDTNILNSKAMKQHLQHTALQKAAQPVARNIKTGLEQFDLYDTDEAIQQQADDNTADLEDLQVRKKKKDKHVSDVFTNDLSTPSIFKDMITSTTAPESRGYLRGSTSSSTPLATEDKPDDTKVSTSKSKGNLRGSSSSAAAATILEEDEDAFYDIPPVKEIIQHINLSNIEQRAET